MNWNSWMVRHFWFVGVLWTFWTLIAAPTPLPVDLVTWLRVLLAALVGCLTGVSFVAYGAFKGRQMRLSSSGSAQK